MLHRLDHLTAQRAFALSGCPDNGWHAVEVWQAAVSDVAVELQGRVGGHADIAESSEMLTIRPDLVRQELAEEGYMGGFSEELLDRIFRDGFRSVTPNGILGDARGMSAEIGERCIARAADTIAAALFRRSP